jgi:solute carrier family 25 phosphate transporter 23/24/25/41
MIYEGIRPYFIPDGGTNPGAIGKLASGAVSGAVAQTLTYPL